MKALIIVDVQNDFLSQGALAVKDGDAIIPVVNELQKQFDLVVATQDWHPPGHGSFASSHGKSVGEKVLLEGVEQFLWPQHCVQGSKGAEFPVTLETKNIIRVFQKGMDKNVDSYSGFFDNAHKKSTGLGAFLRVKDVTEVYIVGLATDYCVKFTSLDAVMLGFKTFVIKDACRGVDATAGDVKRAFEEMQKAGVTIV
ncbi:MAG: bifunctional nicotinamidase/pyrazinamidase [Candidatus Omnitrophota bacterium]|jgi:nicotinamidase/pyrazinamidase